MAEAVPGRREEVKAVLGSLPAGPLGIGLGVVLAITSLFVLRARPKLWQGAALLVALVSALVALVGPAFGGVAFDLLSVRAAAEVVLLAAAAPLVLLAMPRRSVRWLGERVWGVGRLWRSPVVALVATSAYLTLMQTPELVALARHAPAVWLAEGALLGVVGLAFWWPILSPEPGERLPAPLQMLYFFVASVAVTLISVYLIFAGQSLFSQAPVGVSSRAALADQQLAGVVLKAGTEVVFGVGLVANFVRWAREADTPGPAMPVTSLRNLRRRLGIRGSAPRRGPARVLAFPERGGKLRDGSDG